MVAMYIEQLVAQAGADEEDQSPELISAAEFAKQLRGTIFLKKRCVLLLNARGL